MRKSTFIVYILLIIPVLGLTQTPTFHPKWDKRYGGNMEDIISNFQITSDSGFVLGGTSYSGLSGDKSDPNYDTSFVTGDFWIVKTDSLAVKQWDKRYGGNNSEIHLETIQTTDGGYISCGQSFSGISGDKSQPNWDPTQVSNDYWVIKTDSAGNKEWDKRFGGTSFELVASVRQTNDGGYILCGSSFSGIGGDKTQANQGAWDYWVVRINSTGTKLWDKRFGGTLDDFSTCMDKTADGGYLIGGYSKSNADGDKSEPCQGNWDYWVVKINDQGTKVWDKTFGGNYTDWLFCMTLTSDGGFLLGGQSFSEATGDKSDPNHDATPAGSDFWIVKTNSAGAKVWDRTYGGSEIEDISKVTQTSDGGFLCSGESYSPADGNKTEANLGVEQTWVVKTDTLGIFEWDKTIFTYGHDESGTAVPYTEDCFVAINFTQADTGGYVSEMSRGVGDYFMVKLCKDDPLSIHDPASNLNSWQLYPIPANDEIYIKSSDSQSEISHIEIFDMSGKQVYANSVKRESFSQGAPVKIDIQKLPAGIYICRVKNQQSLINLKLIKTEH